MVCWTCGFESHNSNKCYASQDIDGRKLKPTRSKPKNKRVTKRAASKSTQRYRN